MRLGSRKHPSVFSRLPPSAVGTRFRLLACAEAEANGFASEDEGKITTKTTPQTNEQGEKKDENDAVPPAAAVRGRGRALPVFPTGKAVGPPAARI